MPRNPQHPEIVKIRESVRSLIASQGYSSVEKFAHEHDLEQSVLSRFLSGNKDLMLSTLLRIADALNVDSANLLMQSFQVKEADIAYRSEAGQVKSRQRPAIKVLLSEVSSLTVLRSPSDLDPLVLKGSIRGKKP